MLTVVTIVDIDLLLLTRDQNMLVWSLSSEVLM